MSHYRPIAPTVPDASQEMAADHLSTNAAANLAAELTSFFSLVDPSRLHDVDRLAAQYAQTPDALIDALSSQYAEQLQRMERLLEQRTHGSPADYPQRIRAMFKTYAPQKLEKLHDSAGTSVFDRLMLRYAGRERDLLVALTLKYGPEPPLVTPAPDSVTRTERQHVPIRHTAPVVAPEEEAPQVPLERTQCFVRGLMANYRGPPEALMARLVAAFGPEPPRANASDTSWEARFLSFTRRYWGAMTEVASRELSTELPLQRSPPPVALCSARLVALDSDDPFPERRLPRSSSTGRGSYSGPGLLFSEAPVLPIQLTAHDLADLPSLRGDASGGGRAAPSVFWLSRVLIWDSAMTGSPLWRTVVVTESAMLIATQDDDVEAIVPFPGPDNSMTALQQLCVDLTLYETRQAPPNGSAGYGGANDDDVSLLALQVRPSGAARRLRSRPSYSILESERSPAPLSVAEAIVRKAQHADIDVLRSVVLVFPGLHLGARRAVARNDATRHPIQWASGRDLGARFLTVVMRVIARNDAGCLRARLLEAGFEPAPSYVAEASSSPIGLRLDYEQLAQHVRLAQGAARKTAARDETTP